MVGSVRGEVGSVRLGSQNGLDQSEGWSDQSGWVVRIVGSVRGEVRSVRVGSQNDWISQRGGQISQIG